MGTCLSRSVHYYPQATDSNLTAQVDYDEGRNRTAAATAHEAAGEGRRYNYRWGRPPIGGPFFWFRAGEVRRYNYRWVRPPIGGPFLELRVDRRTTWRAKVDRQMTGSYED